MQKNAKKKDASGAKSEFWGICCESGKRYSQIVCKKYHISMAALDPTDTMTSPCVSLMLERDGCQYLLCSLKPDSILQVTLNLYFDKGENITFFLRGHGTVHLSGYYICDETDGSNTDNVKKGEVDTLSKKGKKPQTSFTVSEDIELESSDEDESSDVEESSAVKGKGKVISPIKKVPIVPSAVALKENKNQKAKSKVEDSSEDETSDDDDDSEDEDTGKDGELLKTYATKRMHSTVESEEESSDEEDSSDSELQKAGIIKQKFQNKKFKADASTPAQNIKAGLKTPNKSNVVVVDPHTGKPDMNSSIGRTPMPKKPVSSIKEKNSVTSFLAEMKNQSKTPKKDSSDSDEMETSSIITPEKKSLSNDKLDTPAQSESAKKKKKKKKAKAVVANESQETTNKTPTKQQFSHKISGVEYDDIRIGNGLPAKKGKLIHVYYTGKLENNKVFDSCQQGSKPFSFKLAAGQVIKGWDLGIEGMKVGGKRRLKIPPNMGYGNQRMGDIPPNSTLYFVVELKAVS